MPFGFLERKSSKPGSSSRSVSNARKTIRSALVDEGSLKAFESSRSGSFHNYSPILALLSAYLSPAELGDKPPPAKTQYQKIFNANYGHERPKKYHKNPCISTGNNVIEDDPYGFLTDFDTVFLIDDSGSMRGKLWKEVETALQVILPICIARDLDGVDFYFLNTEDDKRFRNVTNPDVVAQIFQSVRPYALTPTGKRLNDVMRPYLNALQTSQAKGAGLPKPLNIIVITDGRPSDNPEDYIVQAASMLDALDAPAWQIGIQFFQVGGDQDAAKSLIELDDGLKERYGIRDMVDTVPFKADVLLDGKFILKVSTSAAFMKKIVTDSHQVVTGAINRRLDRYAI